uniref:Uncharacterized protein n=1 Tax=Lepeophtheirus salmonis TaxID=72036 RepID=A0A0K2V457_LEPSM
MNRFPIPNIQEFASELIGRNIFSHVHLIRAFYQIPIHPSDVPKTAVITSFGLCEYIWMPFTLRNAAKTLQIFMHPTLRRLSFVSSYIAYLLIASPN